MAGTRFAFFLLAAFLFVSGCGPKPGAGTDKDVVVSINDYKVTRGEFESEFKDSAYGAVDTPESRRTFLSALIDRKLILQYAQKEGFDKETHFLKAIEKFWEQSLLKVVLDKKTIEIASQTVGADWETQRAEETKKMNDWMSGLRRGSRITVDGSAMKNAAGKEGGH